MKFYFKTYINYLTGGAILRDPTSAENFSSLSLVRALVGKKSRRNLN